MAFFSVVAAALCGAPAVAQASRVELTGTAGPAAEVFPLYRAAKGERNHVHVTLGSRGVTIFDSGVRRIHPTSTLCKSLSRRRVFCDGSFYVEVRLGDRNDTVTFSPGGNGRAPATANPLSLAEDYSDNQGAPTATTFVYGGPGNDVISGSNLDDFIDPGPGRDRVMGRGGDDVLYMPPDGRRDSADGGGGVDTLDYQQLHRPVTVDLTAGTARIAGETESVSNFERVHGTPGADTLLGSAKGDALYGEGGNDHIDGRAGNDLLVGESPLGGMGPNTIVGGTGNDVVDARGSALGPTTTVDCGPGADRETGDVDSLLDPSCEAAVVRIPADNLPDEQPLFGVPMKAAPVASDATGPTFEVPCPTAAQYPNGGCTGTVALQRPPAAGSGSAPESYGSGSFSLTPGQRADVHVTLNVAGQAAVAAGSPVAVHVTGEAAPNPPTPGRSGPKIDFGWQRVLGP
ncbi:MAG: hypothetical protein QOF37_728 [Thermoleophilaceae bacterium]|nr:hypothetical protein [Thermoleophilaceae bacterium]